MNGTRCVAAGIGYHEVVPGQTIAGELRRLVEKLVPEGGGDRNSIPRIRDSFGYALVQDVAILL